MTYLHVVIITISAETINTDINVHCHLLHLLNFANLLYGKKTFN